jgi:lysophospholipid acyltransferase (LPLAT)-like uncharacterized protein
MLRTIKRLLKDPRFKAFLSWLVACYIKFIFITSRVERDIHTDSIPYFRGEKNFIMAFWHGRMMMLAPFRPKGRTTHILISQHRDGKFISDIISHFGVKTLTGSSSRGGREAVVGALRLLKAGDNLGITPDGPRGPNHKAAPGVVAIAKLSGIPIVCCAFSSKRHKHFYSWDRFLIAYPFSHIFFSASQPIMIERDADNEQVREMIEERLNEQVARVDAKLL